MAACTFYGQRTIDADSLSPYVELDIAGGIKVGNKSAPSFNNEAVIKSFEFGTSNGATAEIEILDEQGGTFDKTITAMASRLCDYSGDKVMAIKYGWTTTNCGGGGVPRLTAPIYLVPKDLTVTYEGGKIKYKITAVDPMKVAASTTRLQWVFGTDDHPMKLKDALQQLMDKECPKIKLKWYGKEGKPSNWDFKDEPKSVWDGDNQNKLSSALKWMEYFVSENDRGVYASWDVTSKTPTMIFREGNIPDCYKSDPEGTNSGTYIVNGGKNSNVISFSPSVSWPNWWQAEAGTGGNAGGGWTAGGQSVGAENPRSCPEATKGLGIQETLSWCRYALDTFGPKNAMAKMAWNQRLNATANKISGMSPVEGELKIQGDPSEQFYHPALVVGNKIHVVVINPFHLRDGQCEWLAEPICNSTFTSEEWQVMGCSHSIREGSFVTTLKIRLNPPFTGTVFQGMKWTKPG
jgi:hypothetical protein